EYRNEWVDHSETGDDEVWRARTVGSLHEVGAHCRSSNQRDDTDHCDPVELAGLHSLDNSLCERRHKAVQDSGTNDIEQRAHAVSQNEPTYAEQNDHHDEDRQYDKELTVRD